MAHVMVLDDEPSICWAFRNGLGDDGHRVTVASTAEQGLEKVAGDPPDVMFLDVRLPGMDGLAALGRFRDLCPGLPIVVMTAHGTVETAVGAVRGGAFDYLPKPFDLARVRLVVRRALEGRSAAANGEEGPATPGAMIGGSMALQMVFKQVALAAHCAEPVLITGESGTGKELVARAIHHHGDRAGRPFVAVHLAAMPEGLVERELFGHEKGAYTGADAPRAGLLDRAGDGTVFFDEVAEAPAAIQAKLLRVLDGGEYRAVGGGAEKHLKARVIAATNRDLEGFVQSGAFRADLFYRLAVLPIQLPPLRDRPEDIAPLWDRFVHRLAPGAGRLDPDSKLGRLLRAHRWPGNVRELRNAAEHAARLAQGGPIHPEHLPGTVRAPRPVADADADDLDAAVARWAAARLERSGDAEDRLYDQLLVAVEAPLLRCLRSWAHGNQSRMARALGLHRTTLRQKLRQHGLGTGGED
ncbi:MAG TPA: sigma-54 dependent transcriptional regulator [Isosphaeraceae bacterium]|jgi:two-component system nitrogen regulation response regulator GlnG|nr:sigma-54 dependent transcriptional regulator [Isosphaeraceae bacterium]